MPEELQKPEQQSMSDVQRPPSGTHVVPPGQQTMAPPESNAHRPQQHSSENEHGSRSGRQVPGGVPKQRHTPATVARHPSLPPEQQLFEAPSPHISPSGWQPGGFWHLRTGPSIVQMSEQQSEGSLHSSPYGRHPLR
jgi:hypothetical protein